MSLPTAPIAMVPTPAIGSARGRSVGLLLAVASALTFSSSGPFIKPLLEAGWSLSSVLTVRMGVAGVLLAPALILAMKRQRRFIPRHARTIVLFGLTAVAGCQIFFFSAMQRMPVAVALLIQYLAPVLLVLLAWARTRQAPSRSVALGSVVAIVGLVLVVDIAGAQFDLLGTVFALCAAACVSVYFLIAERTGPDLPPLALASGGLLVGTASISFLGVSGLIPYAAPAARVVIADIEIAAWLPLLWVAGIATALAYALGMMAVPLIGSRLAAFVGLSEVLFALGFAWLLLGETPAPIQFFGGGLLLVGVILVKMDQTPAPLSPAKRSPVPVASVREPDSQSRIP